jgi:hypothetical protein
MLSPKNYCALALIGFQPAMYQGVYSHNRITIVHNVQVLAKAATVDLKRRTVIPGQRASR